MTGEQAKGKETQQWSIGIRHDGVDGVYQRRMVKLMEQEDKKHKQNADSQVSALTQALIVCPTLDIHTVTGGERRQGRVGTGERGSYNTKDKEG